MAGQMVHVEFPAGDTAKASEFWGSLFGWKFESYPGPSEYLMTRFSENQGGAIYGADGDERGPRVYFDVDDINTGAARVKELGGEAGEAMPVPSMGWFATCTDTEGNKFGLWQTDRAEPGRVAELSAGGGPARSPLAAPGPRAHPCADRRRPRRRRSRARTGPPQAAAEARRRSPCPGSSRDRCR